jgi:glutamine amidotransferase
VAVVDYGAGNLRSVGGALDRLGVGWRLARTPEGLRAASAVVLPGVGSAGAAMRELEKSGLAEAIRGLEPPLLGICLGLQLLFERSDEEGGVRCLGMLPGRVGRLRETPRLPHMGWNHARPLAGHPLFEGLGPEGDWFYFAHSYACDCPPEVALAETTHGASFVSAAGLASVCGVQFHPEKSAGAGLRLLARFLRMAGLETTVEPGRPAAGETVRSRRPWSASEPGAGQRESRASGRSRGR